MHQIPRYCGEGWQKNEKKKKKRNTGNGKALCFSRKCNKIYRVNLNVKITKKTIKAFFSTKCSCNFSQQLPWLILIWKIRVRLHLYEVPLRMWIGIHCRFKLSSNPYPTNIYLFKVNSRITRKRYEICSKLTIKKPERRHLMSLWCFYG